MSADKQISGLHLKCAGVTQSFAPWEPCPPPARTSCGYRSQRRLSGEWLCTRWGSCCMFEKYSDEALLVLASARIEALKMNSPIIDTEYLLLGLIREGDSIVSRLFEKASIKPRRVREIIKERLQVGERVEATADIPLSQSAKTVLALAEEEARSMLHKHIGAEHLLLGILREERSLAGRILRSMGMDLLTVKSDILNLQKEKTQTKKKEEESILREFGKDYTEMAARGLFDPLVGREQELSRIVQILCRRFKNNPILLGDAGVGKSKIVEGLAMKVAQGTVPYILQDKRIFSLDLSLIVAGTKYRGQFEERLKLILRELKELGNVVIYIEELHTLVGAGSAEGSLDAANILKPVLARGDVQCVGATTPREYHRFIEKDRALVRRFQPINIHPPDEDQTLEILRGIRDRYEDFHHVTYADEILRYAVYYSSRYITDRFQPDKAIDVIDEAGSRVKLTRNTYAQKAREIDQLLQETLQKIKKAIAKRDFTKAIQYREEEMTYRKKLQLTRTLEQSVDKSQIPIQREDVEEVISGWTGIPIYSIRDDEKDRLLHMEEELHKRIVGQDVAISAVSRAIRRSRAGLKNPKKPIGSFIFLGPTGVGKTEVVRCLSRFLFGSEKSMIRFDMSEYMEKHSVAKLIGSPPGYVGHEEGGQLTEQVKRNPYSVILFDEIEKAHPDLFHILLQIFEDGEMADSYGNRVDFKNTIVILTSNIGAKFIQKKGRLGFKAESEDANRQEIKELVLGEVKKTFNPEFLNRVDEILVFDPLTDDNLLDICKLMISDLNEVLRNKGIDVALEEEVYRWIINTTCKDRSYGARPLRRAIQSTIEDPLSEKLIRAGEDFRGTVFVALEGDRLGFSEALADKAVTACP
jgi:ATP-dependent Clp protease ATP-binding subunit ClpC